jgi:hypothetical protein
VTNEPHAENFALLRLVVGPDRKFKPRRRGEYGANYDVDAMAAWVASGEPYGVQTGTYSGVVVIDLDPRNFPEGATLDSEIERLGLPPTRTVRTPGGGLHLYYSAPADVLRATSKTDQFGPGVDFKGHNGYVVAPGVHRFDGDYELTDSRRVVALPVALCATVRARAVKQAERTQIEVVPKSPSPSAATVAQARSDVAATLACLDRIRLLHDGETLALPGLAQPVGWDDGPFLLAQRLIGIALHPDSGYTLEDAETDFLTHAPDTEGTYDPKHKWRAATQSPHEYKPRTADALFPDNADAAVGHLTAFERAAAAAADSVMNPPPVLTPDCFNPLGTPLFYRSVLNTLVGPGGLMKTTLALLAAAEHPSHTLFISLEKSRASLLNTARWVGADTRRTLVATSTDEAQDIIATAPPAADLLVVVDSTLSMMARYGWNEDTSTDVGALEAHLMGWYATGRVGCIVLIDHTGHAPGRPRGSSRKGQMVQGRMWVLHPDKGSVTVTCEKDNSGERGESWSYDLTPKGPVVSLSSVPAALPALAVEEEALAATGMQDAGVGRAWRTVTAHPDYPDWKARGLTNRSLRQALKVRKAEQSSPDEDEPAPD